MAAEQRRGCRSCRFFFRAARNTVVCANQPALHALGLVRYPRRSHCRHRAPSARTRGLAAQGCAALMCVVRVRSDDSARLCIGQHPGEASCRCNGTQPTGKSDVPRAVRAGGHARGSRMSLPAAADDLDDAHRRAFGECGLFLFLDKLALLDPTSARGTSDETKTAYPERPVSRREGFCPLFPPLAERLSVMTRFSCICTVCPGSSGLHIVAVLCVVPVSNASTQGSGQQMVLQYALQPESWAASSEELSAPENFSAISMEHSVSCPPAAWPETSGCRLKRLAKTLNVRACPVEPNDWHRFGSTGGQGLVPSNNQAFPPNRPARRRIITAMGAEGLVFCPCPLVPPTPPDRLLSQR
ncbi:hypothetical protein B0H67DRAFT_77414 [Lasiosphaeris hirsuta]|uniref:Uncharacterized protein n=1 Tax=Lasiosphaeris hirsuta TaxID=260670 RepID=A0AA40E7W5_9PEZI|nr:hypothetical protein B0H67DRAFT_77414 [Lasiosphaeris hirsuta]